MAYLKDQSKRFNTTTQKIEKVAESEKDERLHDHRCELDKDHEGVCSWKFDKTEPWRFKTAEPGADHLPDASDEDGVTQSAPLVADGDIDPGEAAARDDAQALD